MPNVLGYLIGRRFDPARKWVSFGISMTLAYAVAVAATEADGWKWFIAFFNGFLIFAAAVGINQASASPSTERDAVSDGAGKRFFAGWFGSAGDHRDDDIEEREVVGPP